MNFPRETAEEKERRMSAKKLKVILLRYTSNPEELIALAAKLCYSAADIRDLLEKLGKSDQKQFVETLAEMGHHSPLEHAYFNFGVEGISRSCSHQLVRHRIASYSQQSQRYVSEHSKKNQDGVFDYVIPHTVIEAGLQERFEEMMKIIQGFYDELSEGLERCGYKGEAGSQDARFVLPNAAETKIIITMNARELIDSFFKLRTCLRAQWEIREMATEMFRLALGVAPNIFKNAGPACVKGPCPEGKMCCGKLSQVRKQFKEMKAEIVSK